ncbi:MAG: type II toxin-antitoxin system RelE/ParE family toxin [Candidatus Rokubacteria bacterium]|nr:type II toxin-antitoxin system RelE/ParE family toxin [Candidatus Rokubacteria bacterium]
MAPSLVRFHPEARAEVLAARDWYAARNQTAADRFVAEVEQAVEAILEAPDRRPRYLHRTRRYVLPRFPFSIIYRPHGSAVHIFAVAHAKRRPGYWKERRF